MLSSREKLQQVLEMKPPKDRTEIPVFPTLVNLPAKLGGYTQAEVMTSNDIWLNALDRTFEIIGKPDVSMVAYPGDSVFTMPLSARIPGRELPDDVLYQFIEKPYYEDNEYKKMYEMGWNKWFMSYMMKIQNPPMTDIQQLYERFSKVGMNGGKAIQHLYSKGIEPIYFSADQPIFDTLSLTRSMADFICDLYDDPGPIMDVCIKYQPISDENNIRTLKMIGGTRMGVFAMRSSAAFVSPAMFEEFVWPVLKPRLLRYHEAGIVNIIHADANWLPMLKYFTELPKGCCHIQLDGATDIFSAYDILKGSQSISGDVPATMLAYGTPDQVREYCEKLITELGMKGGFMLGSGCEVPLNAKVECLKAMMDTRYQEQIKEP